MKRSTSEDVPPDPSPVVREGETVYLGEVGFLECLPVHDSAETTSFRTSSGKNC